MKIGKLFIIFIFATLMAIGSLLRIPLYFTAIPATLQLAVCLISGAFLGEKGGAAAMLIYVCLTATGLYAIDGMEAVAGYILGSSGGFIIGFVPCAFLTGRLSRFFYKPCGSYFIRFASVFVSCAVSTMLLYFLGALYFSLLMDYGFIKALTLTAVPFIWLDLIKILLSTCLILYLLEKRELLSPVKNLYKI